MAKIGPDLTEFDPKSGAPAPDIGFIKGKTPRKMSDGPQRRKDGTFKAAKYELPSGNIRVDR